MKQMKLVNLGILFTTAILISACGSGNLESSNLPVSLQPVGVPSVIDGGVVHGRAIYTIENQQQTAMMKLFQNAFLSTAFAASGSSNVTYTNAGSTNFSINVSALGAAGFTGDILKLGNVSISNINDNNLKVCGTGGNTKCVTAAIRVYTTGTIAGFVNTADSYGVPVFTGTLNPTTPVGLGTAGSVQVQTLSISGSKRTIKMSDFPSPSYSVTSDFSNAGAGNYSMTYVVEYVLF